MIKKWIGLFSLLLALCMPALGQTAPAPAQKVQVVYFGSPYCLHCRHMEKSFLDGFLSRNANRIDFVRVDVTKYNLAFMQALKEYGVASGGTPAMVIGEEFLMGYPSEIGDRADLAVSKAIMNKEVTHVKLPKELLVVPAPQETEASKPQEPSVSNTKEITPVKEEHAPQVKKEEPAQASVKEVSSADSAKEPEVTAKPQPTAPVAAAAAQGSAPAEAEPTHQDVFNQLTFWMIAGAGLVDGINPCAFAVIVFFISFLSVYKYEKREIVAVGTAYCAAVFIAYVLLGLGAFKFLYAMQGFYYVMWGLKIVTVLLCVAFLLLSAYDCWHYYRTKDASGLVLQLPTKYKTFIHKVMHAFLKDRSKSVWRLGIAALIVGFVVSLVEAVCTGQVYLPTIVVVLKEAGDNFWRAAEFLLVYNVMFIVPLVLVFALALAGYESATFSGWLKKHLGLAKLLLCAVFVVLLVLLLQNW